MNHAIKVVLLPEEKEIFVIPGTSALEAAGLANILMEASCGGKGLCGKCKIRVLEGGIPSNPAEEKVLGRQAIDLGFRMACQAKINSECKIFIPAQTRLSAQKILTSGIEGEKQIHPSVWKQYVELPAVTLENQVSDLDLLRENVQENFCTNIYVLRKVHSFLKSHNYRGTCVFSDGELINLEQENTTGINYGAAFDIGTTTVVGALLDTNTGKEIALSSRMNPQVVYGDDVVSRIRFIIDSRDGLDRLHFAIIGTMNEMLHEMAVSAGISAEHIYKIVLCGNSTMQHIVLRISPEGLGSIPFSLVFREGIDVKAKRLGLQISPDGTVYTFPNIGGFVGGDTVGVILSTSQYRGEKINLSVDIGTNGEIVLGNSKRLISASTAAGPAFEGARISQGMRASAGAIEKVVFAEDVFVSTIANHPACGICGSGLIDAVAEMLRTGIIDETGRLQPPDKLKGKVCEKIAERIEQRKTGFDFRLVDAENTRDGHPIFITQKDIRELQLGKAAIFAGIRILEKQYGITDNDISEIFLAGGFGNFIRRSSAKRIGLIPNIQSEKIRFVGNASLSGAKLLLLSRKLHSVVETISTQTEYIELSISEDFQNEFANAMMFPGGVG
jgi:uncharacterized 2Fe-2S/4Fe-4S cluster protein (DUF4445 family)